MQIIRGAGMQYIPASHEDPNEPGVFKKVLFTKEGIPPGQVQMINWSMIPPGKSFKPHSHKDMLEIFIIISGKAEIKIEGETAELNEGDAVYIPALANHQMQNTGSKECTFIALGIVP